MTEGTIAINGTEYEYKFGMKQVRKYMQAHKLTTMPEYWQELASIGEQTPDGFGVLAKALRSAVSSTKGLPKDNDDLLDAVFVSGDFETLVQAIMASMPKIQNNPDPSGKS